MKRTDTYVCEICGRKYDTEIGATMCEKLHRQPVKVVSAEYSDIYNNRTNYPTSVLVEMEDGHRRRFYYKN